MSMTTTPSRRRHRGSAPGTTPTAVVTEAAGSPRRDRVAAGLVVVLGLAWSGWGAGRPGIWRDEAATIVACRRSTAEMVAMTGNLDLVHLAYYLLAHGVWSVSPTVTAVRWISVVAMALAAGGLARLGAAMGSARTGLVAGLLLVVDPFAGRYAQEARPFALAALAAVLCTLAFVRLQEGERRSRPGYVVAVVALGVVNVLALLLVGVHGALALGRRRLGLWVRPAAAGLVLVAPFTIATFAQRGQVSWIEPPHAYDLRALLTLEFGSRTAPAVVGLVVLALVAAAAVLSRRRPSLPPARRAVLWTGLAWAVLPVLALFAVSQVVPLWDAHYLVFTVPGLALALAALVASPSWAAAVTVVAVAACGIGAQVAMRDPATGHTEDLASVAAALHAGARPGDTVVYLPAELRVIGDVFPEQLAGLSDPTTARTPRAARDLVGTPLPPAAAAAAVGRARRVWVVEGRFAPPPAAGSADAAVLGVLRTSFTAGRGLTVTDVRITPYTATPPTPTQP